MNQLIAEIPEGAEMTVVLKNGHKFTGIEDTRLPLQQAGVLRMYKNTGRPMSTDYTLFLCLHDDIAYVTMEIEG